MRERKLALLCAVVALLTGALMAPACASIPDETRYTVILLPEGGGADFAQFAGSASSPGVHSFLERRCGTLDCHGQIGRPFRLYSAGGLRAENDAGNVSGKGAETPDELYANYVSIVGLEPEQLSRVTAGDDPPTELLIVKKPLALETHKGGAVLSQGDPGDTCLESWLVGQTDQQKCTAAAQIP